MKASVNQEVCTKIFNELKTKFPHIPFVQDASNDNDYIWVEAVETPTLEEGGVPSTCLVQFQDNVAFMRSHETHPDSLLSTFPEEDEVWEYLDDLLLISGFTPDMADKTRSKLPFMGRDIQIFNKRG